METLDDRIAREGSINELDAVGWAIRLAKRLEVLHAMGVVHGSVSPKCVLTTAPERDARAVLADVRRTTSNPLFQSPERLLTGNLSPADDVWAVAATLYTTLTGTPPFVGGNDAELKQKILVASPAPLAVFDVGDDDLQHILDTSFNRDLARRTTSVGALRRALEEWHPDPNARNLPPLDDDDESTDHSLSHEEGNDEETVMKRAPFALQQFLAGRASGEGGGDSDEDEVKTVMREIPQTLQELLRRDDTRERPGVNSMPTPVAPPPAAPQPLPQIARQPPLAPHVRQPTLAGAAPVAPSHLDRPPLHRQPTATQAAPLPVAPNRQNTATGQLPVPQPRAQPAPPPIEIDDEESSDDAVRTVMLADALAAVGLVPGGPGAPPSPIGAPPLGPPSPAGRAPVQTQALPAVDDSDEDEVRTVMREAPQLIASWQAALGPPPAPPPPTPPGEGSGSHPQPLASPGQQPTMALDLASMVNQTLGNQPQPVAPDLEMQGGGGTSPGVVGHSDWRPPAQTSPLESWDTAGFGPHGTSAMSIVGPAQQAAIAAANPGLTPSPGQGPPPFGQAPMPMDPPPASVQRSGRSWGKLLFVALLTLVLAAAGTWAFLRYRSSILGVFGSRAADSAERVASRETGLSKRCIVAVNPPRSTSTL